MSTFRIGWRNLWRNSGRTGVTATAIALATAILIALFGLMEGMMADTVNNVTYLVVGDAQIHAPEYRSDRSFYKDVAKVDQILAKAEAKGIGATPRAYGYGLVSVGHKSAGAEFWGVDPSAERKTFKLAEELNLGHFLSDAAGGADHMGKPVRELVLGRQLAKSLHAVVGTEIVAVVQAADGSLGNELFTVTGVLKTCGEGIDRSAAIIHKQDFEELFVSGGRIHEIALSGRGSLSPEQVVAVIEPVTRSTEGKAVAAGSAGEAPIKAEAAPGMEILTWKQLMPTLADMVSMFDAVMIIFGMIFFMAAGLGVLNTMLMATFERIREFGVLKALGATPWRILRDVSVEAFILGLFSTAIGAAIGLAVMVYLHEVGIDLSYAGGDITFSGIAFNPIWKSTMNPQGVISPVITMWIVCVLAALYPAAKAARLDPVRAMTHV